VQSSTLLAIIEDNIQHIDVSMMSNSSLINYSTIRDVISRFQDIYHCNEVIEKVKSLNALKAQCKKTVLKDESVLLDFSSITSYKSVSTVDLIESAECELHKIRAVSFCGVQIQQMVCDNRLLSSLVILNISGT
jgi:hypothetical protein